MFRSLGVKSTQHSSPAIPDGQRVYAIGDVHGRLDLLKTLIAAIEDDDKVRGKAETSIIMLGDLIDRGPDSAGVLSYLRALSSRTRVSFLMGNHEEMLLSALTSTSTLRAFINYGGRETFLSYNISQEKYEALTIDELYDLIPEIIPYQDIEFIRTFEDYLRVGDYIFVHAGIRPGVAFSSQAEKDFRWIREPFLSHSCDFEYFIIHGHTISDAPEIRHNRIGVDTGAYRSGKLTALGLEGERRWLLSSTTAGTSRKKIA